MGIEALLGKVAAPLIGSVVGGLFGGSGGGGGQQTQTTQNQLDPRIAGMLFGTGQKTLKPGAKPTGTDANGNPTYADSDYTTSGGLLQRYQGLLDKPQNSGLETFGNYNNAYMANDAMYDTGQIRNTSWALANSDGKAPQIQAAQGNYTTPFNVAQSAFPGAGQPSTANFVSGGPASLINAPSQNNIGLSNAYDDFINGGNLGNNTYLAGAIQKGLNQSSAAFQNLQNDATQQFKESILPALRGEAIANGQYGGSREGIAEGKAADSLARNMTRALSQVGQNMTDAAVSAQAGAYDQDRARQLAALSGLSGQQYGVAGANAGAQNQVNLSNAQMQNNSNQFNAGVGNNYLAQLLQNNQFNAAAKNAGNAMQYQGNQQMNMQNLANQQGTNQFNAGNTMGMAQLNSQNKATGAGLLGNLVNQQYGYANNQNDYAINQAGKVNGLLAPYLSANSSTTSSAPLYQNQGANILGGALAGQQLFKQFGSGGDNTDYSGYMNRIRTPNTNLGISSSSNTPYIGDILNNNYGLTYGG